MRFSRKSFVTVLLTLFALVCSIITAYIFSIQWWGGWRYTELIAPMCGFATAGILALAGMVVMRGRQPERAKTLRSILMMGACYGATTGLSFAVLANCSVSCGERTIETVQSRVVNGQRFGPRKTALPSLDSALQFQRLLFGIQARPRPPVRRCLASRRLTVCGWNGNRITSCSSRTRTE